MTTTIPALPTLVTPGDLGDSWARSSGIYARENLSPNSV